MNTKTSEEHKKSIEISDKDLLIADSDFLIGLVKPTDVHHEKVVSALHLIRQKKLKLRIPATVAAETITLLRKREENGILAEKMNYMIQNGQLPIIGVSEEIIQEATTLFDTGSSKNNTFFDAIVIAIYRHMNAMAILSFDRWYTVMGCKTVDDILTS